MSQIIKNGDGTVTMPEELLKSLLKEYETKKADVERAVTTIARMLQILGIIKQDGSFRDDFRFRHLIQNLTGIVTQSLTNNKALQERFQFVTDPENIEMIRRYSYLYQESAAGKKEKDIVELEFEEI